MGIISANKLVSSTRIGCNDTAKVTIAITAAPDITSNPTDIALVLDRSGSMAGSPLANMKLGANKFIDIIDESTDGSQDGQIGSGSRIGIVSFATDATQDTQLITSVAALKASVNALTADGSTNHADAFTKAIQLFDTTSANAKVIVMFTDGKTTVGAPPAPVAAAARAMGITIYCIGLVGDDGIDVATLNDWASDPDAAHVAITPDDGDLDQLFENLAANIAKPGATDIQIDEILNADFELAGAPSASKGLVTTINSTTVRWQIDELGVTNTESATLEFFIRHPGPGSGSEQINQAIVYDDAEDNTVVFPNPTIIVACDTGSGCPEPVDIEIPGCEDSIEYNLGDVTMQSLGRILQLDVTVRNVCPNKRVALGVVLTEVDPFGVEHRRGMKTITVPAHNGPGCQDILVRCINFVVPEDLNVSGPVDAMCSARNFRARVIAHPIDNDFNCCGSL